jgi:uncharacterized protein (DUF2252 family)
MVLRKIPHPSLTDRKARGKQARSRTPLSSQASWTDTDRPDPVGLLEQQDSDREPDLVPVRHGRMQVSPFTFYRGAAKIMAADLATTPTAGLEVQLCGDAHLSNFGVFASPERRLLFDLNDFDETLKGPFEYDVKRMAASFTIAGRNNVFAPADTLAATQRSVASYRQAMAAFAEMRTMEIWYARLEEEDVLAAVRVAAASAGTGTKKGKKAAKKAEKTFRKGAHKARSRDSLQALSKLGELVDGRFRLVSQPPVLVPMRDVERMYGIPAENFEGIVRDQFRAYRASLRDDQRELLERFQVVDVARKVVGVGSVGTRAFIVLLQGRDEQDPLFLQIKEATASVLEDHLPRSRYRQHGKRVVCGQRMMQAASDIYLGWTVGPGGRHFYWRQLRDMKASATVETMRPTGLNVYADLCGWTLARAHARSGDPVAIAAYLGAGDKFDRAVTDFAERYAAQNERDYAAFSEAIRSGRLEAVQDI